MHISNDRYFRDRQRHDLALRMIRHEARTHTIRSCTGLTDDRIRRLFKTFARHHTTLTVRRHRGKSPRQISYFTRNLQMQFEASCLSSTFAAFGLVQPQLPADEEDSLEYGERFCDAFETHRQLVQAPRISFEHAWFLLQLLSRGATLRPTRCRHCSSRYLRDRLNAAARRCPFCELKSEGDEYGCREPQVHYFVEHRPTC
jgi:hypothetical protein